jgi:hypothetical protein
MIFFLIAIVFAVGGALLYASIGNAPPTTPEAAKVAELCRIAFAAAMFAIMFALCLGLHEELVRVTK